jgi:hypothetical protein
MRNNTQYKAVKTAVTSINEGDAIALIVIQSLYYLKNTYVTSIKTGIRIGMEYLNI